MSDSQKRKLATHKYTYTHTEVKNNFHLAVAVLLQKYPKMPLEKEQKKYTNWKNEAAWTQIFHFTELFMNAIFANK